MRKSKVTEKQIEELYQTCKKLILLNEYTKIIGEFSNSTGLSRKTIILRLCSFTKKYSLPPVRDCISKNRNNLIASFVRKSPNNISEALRRYVKHVHPDVDENSEKFKWLVQNTGIVWYNQVSKQHVCFMMASNQANPVVNRKNTTSVVVDNKKSVNDFIKRMISRIKARFIQ